MKTRMNNLMLVLLTIGMVALFLVVVAIARADAPTKINYQGKLTDLNDVPVPNGNYPITFTIYDAPSGGNVKWTETQMVPVANGVFSILLGSVTPLQQSIFTGDCWLGLKVGTDTEMLPRQQIVSVAYALRTAAHNHWGETWSGSGTGLTLIGSDGAALHAETSTHLSEAIYGENRSSETGNTAIRGVSSNGTGVMGLGGQNGVWGWGQDGAGVIGWGTDGYGVLAQNIQDNNYGLYVWGTSCHQGYATFAAGKSGYVVEICQNGSAHPLETGDVVVISGSAPAIIGDIPVVKIRKADIEYSTAVMGVVDKRYTAKTVLRKMPTVTGGMGEASFHEGHYSNESVAPGEYLSVVTLGAYEAIKVDASYAPIQVGDLLTTSETPGYAMKAIDPKVGTIIGKALEPLTSGKGTIAVLITLQ